MSQWIVWVMWDHRIGCLVVCMYPTESVIWDMWPTDLVVWDGCMCSTELVVWEIYVFHWNVCLWPTESVVWYMKPLEFVVREMSAELFVGYMWSTELVVCVPLNCFWISFLKDLHVSPNRIEQSLFKVVFKTLANRLVYDTKIQNIYSAKSTCYKV